jgi:hypothetical protein
LLSPFTALLYLYEVLKIVTLRLLKKFLKTLGYLLPFAGINPKSIVNNLKIRQMKKLFAIAIIVSALAACNNSGSSSSTTDTTTVAPVDTTTTMDTSSKMMTDTTKKMDTSVKK